jgi:signal transduction histidine kinase
MHQVDIEPKEFRLLKFYVLFQCVIYFMGVIRSLLIAGITSDSFVWLRFLPAIVLLLIFILLSLKKVQQNINRPRLLIILILLSVTTILTRFITPVFSVSIDKTRLIPDLFNVGGFNLDFDQLFFLILPVLFVAWQFSQKTTFLFCGFITFFELCLTLLTAETDIPTRFILIMTINFRGIIFLIMGFFINGMSDIQRSQKIELEKANARLRKYAIYTEQLAQTRERNRLARELHDTLAHTLSSLAVQLEAVKALFDTNQGEAKKGLERSLITTRNGLNETRRALKDLRTSELENFGLCQSLRNLLQSGAARSGFKYTENLLETINLLPDEISHAIYRTVQEAVDNTVKHAKAKNVNLQLDLSDNSLQMIYADDGQGFSPENLDDIKHYGLQGMRERIDLLGGNLTIQSAPNQGTKIIIKMELDNDKSVDL